MSTHSKSSFIALAGALMVSAISTSAYAVAVDLSTWTAEGGGGSWALQTGNDSVLQTVNTSTPTVFYDGNNTAQGQALNGNITVQETGGDDDFIGFVLGYTAAGGIGDATTNFFLVDWKQGTQVNNGVTAPAGIAISHVTNGNANFDDFWGHRAVNGVTEIARGSTLGSTGWADNTSYEFNIVFTSTLINVTINGVEQFNITPANVAGLSSFADGSFGFYNMSQPRVLYSAITQLDCTATPNAPECQTGSVPEPTTTALLALGLLGAGFARKRRTH